MAKHNRWMYTSGVTARSPVAYEISRSLQYGVVNIKALSMSEYMMRRLQLLEGVVAECPGPPSFEGASHYMGTEERAGGAVMAPSLRA